LTAPIAFANAPDSGASATSAASRLEAGRIRHFAAGVAILGAASVAAACAEAPPVEVPPAALSDSAVGPQRVTSVIEPYAAFRPATPEDWRERNERVAPGAEQ
jgi:hypothetical protein